MTAQTVDFQQVKQAATVDHAIRYLGLRLKQHGDTWRGSCHLCKNSDQRAFVITTSKRLFHCFKCKEGGDMLKLVTVSKGIPIRDAAIESQTSAAWNLFPEGTVNQFRELVSEQFPPAPNERDSMRRNTRRDSIRLTPRLSPWACRPRPTRRGRRGSPLPA